MTSDIAVRRPPAPSRAAVPPPTKPRPRQRPRRGLGQRLATLVGAVFFVGFTLYPLAYMLSGSFKTLGETYSGFASLIPKHATVENYRSVLFENTLAQTNFFVDARNSALIAVMTVVMTMAISIPAAFVVARRRSFLITAVRGWVRVAQVVGGVIVIIPLYLILREVGLIDKLFAVSLAETIPGSAFGIWVLAAFIRQIPTEIEESARIDGAGDWRILRYIVLPLARPGITSVALVVALLSWNDFLNPLILLSDPSKYTVNVALYTFLGQVGQIQWGALLAFAMLSCIPPVLVIAFAERHIVRGLVAGAVK